MKYILLVLSLFVLFTSCKRNEAGKQKKDIPEAILLDSIEVVPPIETRALPSVEQVMGNFNPALDSNFVKIDTQYTDKPAIYLQREAYEKFIEMHDAAEQVGIELYILSATRPFDYQRNIWERKYQQQLEKGESDELAIVREILKFSAMPGTSRHHWGTDIDLNYLNNHYFETGKGVEIYTWLQENSGKYGYCQPYTAKDESRPYGYEEEKWHWSYMPIAELYYEKAKRNLSDSLITGFSGSAYAQDLNVVQNYVMGVDPQCR